MGKLISLIYFYLISVIGLVLLIIGLYNIISYAVNVTQYDKYPLKFAGNENCEYLTRSIAPAKPLLEPETFPAVDKAELERQNKECLERVERERKQTQVDDLKNSIYFTLTGAILLAIHLPIALRRAREDNKT